MATIFSNANGQVVQARDVYGVYYYVADGLGTPTVGAFVREEDAIAALERGDDDHVTDLNMDDEGHRLVECAYCDRWVRPGDSVPPADDDEAWEELTRGHSEGCEWVETRAHRREV